MFTALQRAFELIGIIFIMLCYNFRVMSLVDQCTVGRELILGKKIKLLFEFLP